ncbi:MAG: HPr family phosphocarrier protein [Bacilli bacterium]|jgi:phosphocarrier protein|nr:HPr family phosphocarrier protein [Bacilli bacterium]MDY0064488.1 HPr family phosphocarrier protein [Bacilli bacterium]
MKTVSMIVENTSGIDAAMAQKIVQKASEFEADIALKYLNKEVDLKSILGIMSLAVLEGARVEIEARGVDAEEAIAALQSMVVR